MYARFRLPALLAAVILFAFRGTAQETKTFKIGESVIDASLPSDLNDPSRDLLVQWIQTAANAVSTYYGRFPVRHLTLRVRAGSRRGIHHGVTYPEGGGLIVISVGRGTTAADLQQDWTLTHEMIHLAFPSMPEEQHWIEEGLSTYVEPIARAQVGNMSVEEVWRQFASDMPQGQPEGGDEGLDHTHTWGRTYWGGAMFCLLADVQIREATHNRMGLQDALRGILDAGGDISQDWSITRAFAVGDRATGTSVLQNLYRQHMDRPAPTDLDALWKKLGVSGQGAAVSLHDDAPEANLRKAITRRRDAGGALAATH